MKKLFTLLLAAALGCSLLAGCGAETVENYVILDEAVSTEQYAIGFLLGNEEMRDVVNSELCKMAEDGTMEEIAQNYTDSGLSLESLCIEKLAEKAAETTTEVPENLQGITFTVGFDAEFPPFGFIAEDGSYDGFDLAMAEELCNRLGWEFVAQPINWDAKDSELSAGTIDCIWNGFTYTGREAEYTWSDPYVDNSIVLVVKEGSGITSLADMAGKTIAVQAASSAVDAVNGNTDFKDSIEEMVELGDYNLCFMELSQGTADAVAADLGVANYQIAHIGEAQ